MQSVEEKYIGAVLFREMLSFHEKEQNYPAPMLGKVILLDSNSAKKASIQPEKSDLSAYEKAFGGS